MEEIAVSVEPETVSLWLKVFDKVDQDRIRAVIKQVNKAKSELKIAGKLEPTTTGESVFSY